MRPGGVRASGGDRKRRWLGGVVAMALLGLVGLLVPMAAFGGDHGGNRGTSSTTSTSTTTSAAALSLWPTSLMFASQSTGTTSAPQTVTATNTGTASLFFNYVAIGGADGLDFTIVDDQCIGTTLAPGASCTGEKRGSRSI